MLSVRLDSRLLWAIDAIVKLRLQLAHKSLESSLTDSTGERATHRNTVAHTARGAPSNPFDTEEGFSAADISEMPQAAISGDDEPRTCPSSQSGPPSHGSLKAFDQASHRSLLPAANQSWAAVYDTGAHVSRVSPLLMLEDAGQASCVAMNFSGMSEGSVKADVVVVPQTWSAGALPRAAIPLCELGFEPWGEMAELGGGEAANSANEEHGYQFSASCSLYENPRDTSSRENGASHVQVGVIGASVPPKATEADDLHSQPAQQRNSPLQHLGSGTAGAARRAIATEGSAEPALLPSLRGNGHCYKAVAATAASMAAYAQKAGVNEEGSIPSFPRSLAGASCAGGLHSKNTLEAALLLQSVARSFLARFSSFFSALS